uniref:Uncharacterized protein n=1 Tax=Papio anubis TaxID=9555 RepID=A0A8I5N0I6_PAPAN
GISAVSAGQFQRYPPTISPSDRNRNWIASEQKNNVSISASRVAGITSVCHHARLSLVFLVKTRFHHVGQAGLELLTSSDPPASACGSAGITGMSHRAQPHLTSL